MTDYATKDKDLIYGCKIININSANILVIQI
jgi:hypothetical protein